MADYTWRQWEAEQNDANLLHASDCERWQAGIELAGGTWDGNWTDLDTSGKGLITIDQFNALESQIQSKVSSYTPKNYDPDSTVQIVPGPDGWNKVEDGLIKAICQPDGTNINILTRSNTNVSYSTYGGSSYTVEQGVTVEEWGATDANRFYGTAGTEELTAYRTYGMSTAGQNYTLSMYLKNNGDNPIRIRLNGSGSAANERSEYLEKGEQAKIVISITGSGTANIQIMYHVQNYGNSDSFDFTWWHPKIELSDTATDWTPCPTDYGYPSTTLSATATPQSVEDGDITIMPNEEEIQ